MASDLEDSLDQERMMPVDDFHMVGVSTCSWWRGTVVERRSLAGELSLSCA